MSPWPLAFAELRAAPLRSLALALLIGLAVAIGIAIVAQERAVRKGSARAADSFDLVIGAPGGATQLVLSVVYLQPAPLGLVPGRVLAGLAGQPGVAWAAPVAFGDNLQGRPVIGTSADLVTDGGRRGLAAGRAFRTPDEAVAGAEAGLRLGQTFAPQHGAVGLPDDGDADGHHHGVSIHVVGVLPPLGTPWDRAILVPIETMWGVHGLAVGHHGPERIGPPWDADSAPGVSAIVVKPKSVADAYRLRQAHRNAETLAVFPAEVLTELYALLDKTRGFLVAVTAGAQVLVLLAILVAATALVAVRRRQIAALRALGAPQTFIVASVWIELAMTMALGVVAGIAIGYAATGFASHLVARETGVALSISPALSDIVPSLLTVGLGLALAIIPAMLAGSTPAGEALRGG